MFRWWGKKIRFPIYWNGELSRRIRQLQSENLVLRQDVEVLKGWLARTLSHTMPDFIDATWKPSKHFTTGHAGRLPTFIIVHTTPSDSHAAVRAEEREHDGQSVHYIIDREGHITQTVSEEHSATNEADLLPGHARFWNAAQLSVHPNSVAFHIELLSDNEHALTQQQIAIAFVLIKDIVERHKLVKQLDRESGGITSHCTMDALRFPECGKNFPYSDLLAYLAGSPLHEVLAAPVATAHEGNSEQQGQEAKEQTVEASPAVEEGEVAHEAAPVKKRSNGVRTKVNE